LFSFDNSVFLVHDASFCDRLIEPIAHPIPSWFIVSLYSLGDTYLLCALGEKFRRYHCRDGAPLILIIKESHLAVAEMFIQHFDRVYLVKDHSINHVTDHAMRHKINSPFKKDSGMLIHPHHMNDTRVDDFTNIDGVSHTAMFAHLMRMPITTSLSPAIPVPGKEEGAADLCRKHNIVRGRSVILFPDSNSWPQPEDAFWAEIPARLAARGWHVYTNGSGNRHGRRASPLPGSKLIDVPLDLVLPVLSYAGWAIGALCGLMNIIIATRTECRKTIVVHGPRPGEILHINDYLNVTSAYPFAHQRKLDNCDYDIEEFQVRGPETYPAIADRIANGFNANFDTQPSANPVSRITTQISPGELLDKIAVLQVKMKKLGPRKTCVVMKELDALNEIIENTYGSPSMTIGRLIDELREINEQGWEINEQIYSEFSDPVYASDEWRLNPNDPESVSKAELSVRNFRKSQAINRQRILLKNKVNRILGSNWFEFRSFEDGGGK